MATAEQVADQILLTAAGDRAMFTACGDMEELSAPSNRRAFLSDQMQQAPNAPAAVYGCTAAPPAGFSLSLLRQASQQTYELHFPDTPLFSLPRTKPRRPTRPTVPYELPGHPLSRFGRHGKWEAALYPPPGSTSVAGAEAFLSGTKQLRKDAPKFFPGGRTVGGVTFSGSSLHVLERAPLTLSLWAPMVTGGSRLRQTEWAGPKASTGVTRQQAACWPGAAPRLVAPVTGVPPPRAGCRPYTALSTRHLGVNGESSLAPTSPSDRRPLSAAPLASSSKMRSSKKCENAQRAHHHEKVGSEVLDDD